MFCDKVKEFLSQKQIEYADRNILDDSDAMNELVAMGHMTTPVTVIDGEVVVGFDVEKLSALLGLAT